MRAGMQHEITDRRIWGAIRSALMAIPPKALTAAGGALLIACFASVNYIQNTYTDIEAEVESVDGMVAQIAWTTTYYYDFSIDSVENIRHRATINVSPLFQFTNNGMVTAYVQFDDYSATAHRVSACKVFWFALIVAGFGLIFFGRRRKQKLNNRETPPATDDYSQSAPPIDNGLPCDDLAVVDNPAPSSLINRVWTFIVACLKAKWAEIKAYMARRPKLFKTIGVVSIILISLYIGFYIAIFIISMSWRR